LDMMKKTVIAFTCLICILVFSMSAFAENATLTTGVYTGNLTTLEIPKTVIITNTDESVINVYEPKITYTYTIEPATVNATVTSGTDSLTISSGVSGAITIDGNPAFGDSKVTLTNGTGTSTKPIVISVTPKEFQKPGVFRYVIKDTTEDAKLSNAGIIRKSEYTKEYYLDVYAGYKDGEVKTADQLEIKGYVLSATNASMNDKTAKMTGFDATTEGTNVGVSDATITASGADTYPTVNVLIKHLVDGNMADATYEFPYTVSVTQNSGAKYIGVASSTTETSEGDTTVNLKHGETYRLVGLNSTASIAVQEGNTSSDPYKISAIDEKTNTKAEVGTYSNDTKTYTISARGLTTSRSSSAVTLKATGENIYEFVFTDTLTSVSPTGLAMRAMPFAVLSAIAVLILLFFRRRKDEEQLSY
ncbi:MAG: hypothetical protein IJ708_10420, partial [Clostridia bacterium]|nr:hypothetical protein [Clostridia bacterium]